MKGRKKSKKKRIFNKQKKSFIKAFRNIESYIEKTLNETIIKKIIYEYEYEVHDNNDSNNNEGAV